MALELQEKEEYLPDKVFIADRNLIDPGASFLNLEPGYQIEYAELGYQRAFSLLFFFSTLAMIVIIVSFGVQSSRFKKMGWQEIAESVRTLKPDSIISSTFSSNAHQNFVQQSRYAYAIGNIFMAFTFLLVLMVFFLNVKIRLAESRESMPADRINATVARIEGAVMTVFTNILVGIVSIIVLYFVYNLFAIAGFEGLADILDYDMYEGVSLVLGIVIVSMIFFATIRGVMNSKTLADMRFILIFAFASIFFTIFAIIRGVIVFYGSLKYDQFNDSTPTTLYKVLAGFSFTLLLILLVVILGVVLPVSLKVDYRKDII